MKTKLIFHCTRRDRHETVVCNLSDCPKGIIRGDFFKSPVRELQTELLEVSQLEKEGDNCRVYCMVNETVFDQLLEMAALSKPGTTKEYVLPDQNWDWT